jgi:hypothetical protein
MVKEARFRPAISANAYVDAPNRALLIGSYSPGPSAEKAAARRRSRRFILRLRRERTVEFSQRHPSIGVLLPPAVDVFLLDNGHPPQHRPDIVEKRFTGQRSALRRGSPDARRQQR